MITTQPTTPDVSGLNSVAPILPWLLSSHHVLVTPRPRILSYFQSTHFTNSPSKSPHHIPPCLKQIPITLSLKISRLQTCRLLPTTRPSIRLFLDLCLQHSLQLPQDLLKDLLSSLQGPLWAQAATQGLHKESATRITKGFLLSTQSDTSARNVRIRGTRKKAECAWTAGAASTCLHTHTTPTRTFRSSIRRVLFARSATIEASR